jgi:hypothetical protein
MGIPTYRFPIWNGTINDPLCQYSLFLLIHDLCGFFSFLCTLMPLSLRLSLTTSRYRSCRSQALTPFRVSTLNLPSCRRGADCISYLSSHGLFFFNLTPTSHLVTSYWCTNFRSTNRNHHIRSLTMFCKQYITQAQAMFF